MDQTLDRPLRERLGISNSDILIFGCDITTQPHYGAWASHDPYLHLKCARALPVAREQDVVVLSGPLDREYYEWLRGLGLGPREVIAYGLSEPKLSLPEMVAAEPARLREVIQSSKRNPVWVPFYSSTQEEALCRREGFRLFGCREETALQFFDKRHFKNLCRELGLPTVQGAEYRRDSSEPDLPTGSDLETLIVALLNAHSSVVVRGALGSAGQSVYEVNSQNVAEALRLIAKDHGTEFLIEPFLQVIASPNDQWCITEKGSIEHVGISAQLFSGLRHVGNLYGQYFSKRVMDSIRDTSVKIAEYMAKSGYRGIFGIDYIVTDESVFPIENNARLNGSTFAFGIIDNIRQANPEICCWKFFKAKMPQGSFKMLRETLEPVLYDGEKVNSLFPFDCDLLPSHGTFAALLAAEDLYHIEHLERALVKLGVERV